MRRTILRCSAGRFFGRSSLQPFQTLSSPLIAPSTTDNNCTTNSRTITAFSTLSSAVVDNVRSAALDSISNDDNFQQSSDLDREFLDRAVRLCQLAGTSTTTSPQDYIVPGEDQVRDVNPFDLVSKDMRMLNGQIKELLGSDHPVLETVAQYFFDVEGGKKIRPTMVLLMSRACNEDALAKGIINTGDGETLVASPSTKQVRLAEITEMIHTASLLHDDVIDTADSRRGVESVNSMFGNKLAVLGK